MSHALACTNADKVAAIASVAGGMAISQFTTCTPSRPIPVMEIHGDADNIVAYNSNIVSYEGLNLNIVPVDTLIQSWRTHNSCAGSPVVTAIPNINTNDGSTATRYDYSCQSGSSVVLIKITGGGHTWPGGFPIHVNGPTNADFSASLEIWKFLHKYSNPNSVIGIQEKNNAKNFIYPNPCQSYLQISLNDDSMNNYYTVTDINGKIILSGYINNNQQLTTGNLHEGVYILTLQGNKTTYHYKFLKFQ